MTVSAIITADIHLREDQPICRTDDYWQAQLTNILHLASEAKKYQCPILDAGDLFHRWKASPFLLSTVINVFSGVSIYTVPGNHDLPQHNFDLLEKSSLAVLQSAKITHVLNTGSTKPAKGLSFDLYGFPWGSIPLPIKNEGGRRGVALLHKLTWHKEKPYPDCKESNAETLLKEMKGYDLIVTGDNHSSFMVESRGRKLLNPGSMMIMTADQIEYIPKYFLWNAETNDISPREYPGERGDLIVSREHIKSTEKASKRIDSFVRRLANDKELSLSFEANMERFLSANKVDPSIKQIIHEVME